MVQGRDIVVMVSCQTRLPKQLWSQLIGINTSMKSYDFESQTAAAPITPEKSRMASLKKQKDVAEMALSAERKRQTIALAQKQIIKASEVK